MNDQQLLRYSRHILLPELDIKGQQKILDSKVLVIGCGGLGSAVIPVLAASGVGQLTIVDNDKVELSNLQRQTYYREQDIDSFKAEVIARYIMQQNSDVKVNTLTARVELEALLTLCCHHDVVIDCTDNFVTRKAVNKASVLTKTPLVFGSAIRFEGQLSVFDPRNSNSPCYACLFDGEGVEQETCSNSGVFSPLVGIIGTMQAAEALKIITDNSLNSAGKLLNYNALTMEFYPVKFGRNPYCKVCSS